MLRPGKYEFRDGGRGETGDSASEQVVLVQGSAGSGTGRVKGPGSQVRGVGEI